MSFIEDLKNLLKSYGLFKEPEEEMISYEVVYEPDTKDAHGEWMSKSTVEEAYKAFKENLDKGIVKSNLFHIKDTESFTIEDMWINKELDVYVDGTDQPIKAGTWVAKLKYHDKDLWELKKQNVIGGLSIGGVKGYVNKETGEITNITFPEQEEEANNA